jgi:hypothetical protein
MEVLLRRAQGKIKPTGMNFKLAVRHVGLGIVILVGCVGLAAAQASPLAVVDEPWPAIDAGVEFHILLHARGGVPPYVWSVAAGSLPEGIALTAEGLLGGRPSKPGPFAVTLRVEDSGRPVHTITKEIRGAVSAPLLLEWLDSPKVRDNRIDGSVQVSNGSNETFDLTVIIVAVAENGRATAIGYEHFPLKARTANVEISFGNALPHGAYVIHADAVAEIPARKAILRQRLQTAQALTVTPGP